MFLLPNRLLHPGPLVLSENQLSTLCMCITALVLPAGRDRHKPVARSSGADTLGAVPRPMADFNSLTSEEVAALQQGMDTRTVDDVLGAGMSKCWLVVIEWTAPPHT